MSVSSSLLVGGEDLVGLNLAWSSLLADSSKSTIINLVSDVLSLTLCGSGLYIRDALWRRKLPRLPCCGCVGSPFYICSTGSKTLGQCDS